MLISSCWINVPGRFAFAIDLEHILDFEVEEVVSWSVRVLHVLLDDLEIVGFLVEYFDLAVQLFVMNVDWVIAGVVISWIFEDAVRHFDLEQVVHHLDLVFDEVGIVQNWKVNENVLQLQVSNRLQNSFTLGLQLFLRRQAIHSL